MSKKVLAFLIVVLLALQNAVPALAAEGNGRPSISVISAYYIDNCLHCFVQPNDSALDISSLSIGAAATNSPGNEMQHPRLITDGSSVVNYMLLIDTSTSMSDNRQHLSAFAEALLEEERQEICLTIAGFGASFEIIEENLRDSEQVRQAINQLSFTQQSSDISGAVVTAIAYLSEYVKTGGEICNLVVLTDGDAYLPGIGNNQSEIRKAAEKAKEVIESTPEIVIHTIELGEGDAYTLRALSAGTGTVLSVKNHTDASKAGGSVARFVDGLYYANIPFTTEQNAEFIDAQLMLILDSPGDLEFFPLNHLRNPNYLDLTSLSTPPDDGSGSGTPSGSEEDSVEEDPDTKGNMPDSAPADGAQDGTGDIFESPDAGSITDSENKPAPGGDNNDEESAGIPWIPIAAGVAIAVFVAVLAAVAAGKNRKKSRPTEDRPENSIWIRLELLSDDISFSRTEYPVDGGLVIGSDASCDIVFSDKTVFARNSQIYLRDGVVYIEDITSCANTSLGGMKIHTPNQLRDGDEVMIGRVRFRVKLYRNS